MTRIGFLADTHCRKADGSDLPKQALEAFAGCDMIVHLGDIGTKGSLPLLDAVAPLWVQSYDRKSYVPFAQPDSAPQRAVDAGGCTIGFVFNLTQPDKKIAVGEDGTPVFPDGPIAPLMKRRFGGDVKVVAFGGTHRQVELRHEGVLFLNPGSPTLPSDQRDADDLGSVAVLEVEDGSATVQLIRLTK